MVVILVKVTWRGGLMYAETRTARSGDIFSYCGQEFSTSSAKSVFTLVRPVRHKPIVIDQTFYRSMP